MRHVLGILIVIYNFSIASISQDIILTQDSLLGVTDINGISPLDNDNVLVSGYQGIYVPYITYSGDPMLHLIGSDGELIDSLSYPQFSYLTIIRQMNDGRTLGIATDTVHGRHFFISVGEQLEDVRLNRFLALGTDFKFNNLNEITIEENKIIIDATVTENQNKKRIRLSYDSQTLLIVDMQELPELYGDYCFLSDGTFLRYTNSNLTKYSSDLDMLWHKTFSDIFVRNVLADHSGNIYIAGSNGSPGEDEYSARIMQLDSNGAALNSHEITNESSAEWYTIKLTFFKLISYDDNVIAIGTDHYNADNFNANHRLFIVVYDKDLNQINEKGITVPGRGSWLEEAKLSGNAIYGLATAYHFEFSTSYRFKVEFSEIASNITEEYDNFRIYPNPAIDRVYIDASLPSDVSVHNANGVMLQSYRNANELDISHLPSGIYFITYTSEGSTHTQRLIKR